MLKMNLTCKWRSNYSSVAVVTPTTGENRMQAFSRVCVRGVKAKSASLVGLIR